MFCGTNFVLVSWSFWKYTFLRPYAGGYHADTEIKCCMISVGIVNIAMLVRKINVISLDCMFVIYLCFICVIVLFSPVDNPIHPLSKVDSRFYAKRSRQLNFLVQLLACNKYSSANYGFKRFNYIHSFDSRNICIGRKNGSTGSEYSFCEKYKLKTSSRFDL